MRRAAAQGLVRSESLELYLMWRALGGMNQGISLTEMLTVDGAIIADFVWLSTQQHKARKRKKRRDKAAKEMGGAKTGRHRRRR